VLLSRICFTARTLFVLYSTDGMETKEYHINFMSVSVYGVISNC
jgi:hypothetical protein